MSDAIDEVLIVEDERAVREMLRVSLENAGYHVFEARSGAAVLRTLIQSPCRMLVVLDADLPGASAQSILARAVSDPQVGRHAFVYLTSARAEQEEPTTRDLLANLGAPVLRTPFTVETLIDIVGQAAGSIPAGATPDSPGA